MIALHSQRYPFYTHSYAGLAKKVKPFLPHLTHSRSVAAQRIMKQETSNELYIVLDGHPESWEGRISLKTDPICTRNQSRLAPTCGSSFVLG